MTMQMDLSRIKHSLELRFAELSGAAANRSEIAIESVSDTLDHVQQMSEREIAVRNLDRNANVLRAIRRALARIADGSYGVCVRCEEDIAPKRINAVPWAAACIQCQEYLDRQAAEGVNDGSPLYEAA